MEKAEGSAVSGLEPMPLTYLVLEVSEDWCKMEYYFAGVFSWNKTQVKLVSEGLQYLFGNISQLTEKDKLGLDGEAAWGFSCGQKGFPDLYRYMWLEWVNRCEL